MKDFSKIPRPTGLCFVCGKPTKLLIHAKCGHKCDEEKKKEVPGLSGLTVEHAENHQRNKAKKAWASGKLMPWMKT